MPWIINEKYYKIETQLYSYDEISYSFICAVFKSSSK